MYRCAPASILLALATSIACISPAQAQTHRPFPAYALRGELVVQQVPEVRLNGQPARLAPGSRMRSESHMLLQPASVAGQKLIVHYTVEPTSGLLQDIWVLNAAELANKLWPRSAQEAATLAFDPATQTWSKR
jgi:hypothetical protein